MKPPVLLQVVGLVDRVEGHRRIEVGEEDDQDALADDVVPAARGEEVGEVGPEAVALFWPISWPTVGGIAITEAAKITGITPAMLTRSGR